MESLKTLKKIISIAVVLLMTTSWSLDASADVMLNYTRVEASDLMSGMEFIMVADGNMALPVDRGRTFGYLYTSPMEEEAGEIQVPDELASCNFMLETAPNGYFYIKDSYDRYMYLKGSYNSFDVSATLPEVSAEWSIEINDDGTAKILNIYSGKYIQYDPKYTSYGAYDNDRGVMPKIYVRVPNTGDPSEYKELKSLNDAIEKALLLGNLEFSDPYVIDFEPVVAYVTGAYNYIYEGGRYFLIYKDNLGVDAGQTIKKGWKGKLHNYFGLLELQPEEDTELAGGPQVGIPDPVRIENAAEIDLDKLSAVVYIPNVVFGEDTPGSKTAYSGKIGDESVAFYNNYSISSYPAGTYNVLATIGRYYDQLQVQPINLFSTDSVEELIIDESNECYDLQGNRITEPRKGGIYIRKSRQSVGKVAIHR